MAGQALSARGPEPAPELIVEQQLSERLGQLEAELEADAVTFWGPITYGVDDVIRDAVEAIEPKRQALVVALETSGGYIEVAQRIADLLRHHYRRVDFAIPNFAMSAGTVLVMSADTIHMDYYSVLGPIDPQIERPGSGMVPALGYLQQYERLIAKSKKGELTTAELTFLVEKFDPAELYRYEQARELTISLLKEWLVKYKFKNWKKTATRKRSVSQRMRSGRAAAIAKKLNQTERWHSHGRGISMEVLRRDLKLEIEDFGEKPDRSRIIRGYYGLLQGYMRRLGHRGVVHRKGSYVPL